MKFYEKVTGLEANGNGTLFTFHRIGHTNTEHGEDDIQILMEWMLMFVCEADLEILMLLVSYKALLHDRMTE